MVKTIVGSFDNMLDAARASADLRNAGLLPADVNVHGNNPAAVETVMPASEGRPDDVKETSAVATGAVAGGAIGGAAGVAVSLMGLAIPGIGPILAAGTLATALAGAGAGAVTGGLLGGLTEIGVPEADVHFYTEAVRRGGVLVTITLDDSRARAAEDILRANGAIDIDKRLREWRDSGWTGHDANAAPLSLDQSARERARDRSHSMLPR